MDNIYTGTLTCCDCLEGMTKLPDKCVDLVLCDLPYGVTDCEWDSILPFDKLWEQYNRVLKPDGAAVLFSAQPFTTELIQSNRKQFRYLWYWLKPYATGFTFAKYQPMRRVEDICVFYRKMPTYNPQGARLMDKPKTSCKCVTHGGIYKSSTLSKVHTQTITNYPKNVLKYSADVSAKTRIHPTQKPVALCEYLINTYTDVGDTILDNCSGSGTTAIAAINTGRNYIGYELNEMYYNAAVKRIAALKQSD